MPQANRWRVQMRNGAGSWEGPLIAVWEVALDPMSDDYSPTEITARELLQRWAARVGQEYPNGLIPIYWFIESREAAKFTAAPFAYDHYQGKFDVEGFLDFYGWPEHAVTGERLNWLSLPVADKRWSKDEIGKGGFIQQATGWKPSMLQPFVHLPSLLRTTGDNA